MIAFKPIRTDDAALLSRYYSQCTYRVCEYSVGSKLMDLDRRRPEYAESHGCLIVLSHSQPMGTVFDVPVPLPGMGDVDAALDDIDSWCLEHGTAPAYAAVPAEERERLMARYPYTVVDNDRLLQDYLYRAEDLRSFPGQRYAGQRSRIQQFRTLYPGAAYRDLTPEDAGAVEAFWREYHAAFPGADEGPEMRCARTLMEQAGQPWVKAGAIALDGRLLALSLAEVCGDTLVCHILKALSRYEGAHPAMVQAFAAAHSQGLAWINLGGDAGDRELRTSRLRYLPAGMAAKVRLRARNEMAYLDRVPRLLTERLALDGLREEDIPDYARLCMDDERNKWWGYDYREDLKGELTDGWFLEVARQDFADQQAVNFAIRLGQRLIGEAVLYRFDYTGGAELGCRILPEYAGHGYGAEAFRRAADWSLYELGLRRLKAKCFHENEASRRMLSSCMRPSGEDETFFYFEKLV